VEEEALIESSVFYLLIDEIKGEMGKDFHV